MTALESSLHENKIINIFRERTLGILFWYFENEIRFNKIKIHPKEITLLRYKLILSWLYYFLNVFGGYTITCPILWPLIFLLDFWWHRDPLSFKARVTCLICIVGANAMHIPRNLPLVHMFIASNKRYHIGNFNNELPKIYKIPLDQTWTYSKHTHLLIWSQNFHKKG